MLNSKGISRAAFALTFTSCKKEEQGRLLIYDKGNYLGPKDQKLEQDKVYKLQKQTNRQRDLRT